MSESNRSAAKKATTSNQPQNAPKPQAAQAAPAPAAPAAPAPAAPPQHVEPIKAQSQSAAQDQQPSKADLEAATKPGGQPGAVLPRPDRVPGLSSALATPMQGAEGDVKEFASGPIEAPSDRATQTYPEAGYGLSSTDHTYAAAGGRSVAGEQHGGLVDAEGNAVSAADLFSVSEGKTFVTATRRIYEEFFYPNTTEKASRLLFTEGQRVNLVEAEQIKATLG